VSASRPGRFTPGERTPDTHWLDGWVGPRTGLDVEPLPGLELRPVVCAARYQSLSFPTDEHIYHYKQHISVTTYYNGAGYILI
jgi:hypothetical protein